MKNLLGLVLLMSWDDGIPMKPLEEIEFPDDYGFDWKKLDDQAATLNPAEAEIFSCGEESEMSELVIKTGFNELHDFLNQVFDGDLGKYFWKD